MSAESMKLLHEKMDLIKEQVRTLRKALSATTSSGDHSSVDDLDSKNSCLSILSELAYSFQEIDQVFDACSFMGPVRIADMKTQVEYCLNVVRNLSMETISPAPIILESWFRNIDLMDEILARISEIVIGGNDGVGTKSADEQPKIFGAKNESNQDDAPEPVKSIEEKLGAEKVGSAETPAANKPDDGSGISDKGSDLAVPGTDKSSIEPVIQPTPSVSDDSKQSSAELYAARFARFGPVSYAPTNKTTLSSDKKSNSEETPDKNTVVPPPDASGAVKALKSAEPVESQSIAPDKALPEQDIPRDPSREAGTPDVSEVAGAHAMNREAVKPGLPQDKKVSEESVDIPNENAGPLKPNGDSLDERHSPTAGLDNANPQRNQGDEGSDDQIDEPHLSQKDERAIEETVRKANELIGATVGSSDLGPVPSDKPAITVTDRLSLIHEALEKLINARISEKADEAKRRDVEARSVAPVQDDKNDEERKRTEKEAFLEAIRKQEDIRREEFSQTLMKEVTSLHTELSGKIKELESQIGHLSDKEQRVEAKLETQYREQIDILESRLQRLKDEMASEKLKSGILDERKVLEIIEEREHVNQLRGVPPPMEETPLKTGGEHTPAPENDSRVLGDQTETTADAKRPSVSVWGIAVRAVRFFLLSFLVAICIVGGSWFVLERVLFKEPKPIAATATKTDFIPERKSSAAFNAFADSNPVSLEKRGLRLIVLQLRDNPRASGRVQIANMLRSFRWKGVPDVLLETAKNDPDPRVAAEAFAGFKDITKYPGVADANYAAVDIWWGKNKAEIDAKLEDAS